MKVFNADERHLLLGTQGIGERVVTRLEAAGFHSLRALREAGAHAVTERVMAQVREVAWRNRRRAIERAIARAAQHPGEAP